MELCQENKLKYGKFTNFDKFYIASLFYYCFLLDVQTIHALFPITFLPAFYGIRFLVTGFLAVFVLQLTILRGYVRINKGLFVLSYMFFLLTLLSSAYHQTTYLLRIDLLNFYFIYLFFLFYKRKYLSPLVDIASIFFFVLLIGAIIGFVYAFLGYPPTMTGTLGGALPRSYYLYLTTGAVDGGIIGSIIRPNGIYHEPGGLSLFLCALCFLRVFAKKNDGVTFVLMLLGNITFSMIHMIIFALFILHWIVKYKMKKALVLYVAVAFGVALAVYLPLKEQIDDLLFARFVINESTGKVQGDNRSSHLNNALELLKSDKTIIIWGLSRKEDGRTMMDKVWGYGENPLAPLLKYGIMMSWLYYFYLFFFVLCGIIDRKHFFIYLSISLMLLQRPFFHDVRSSIILILFITSCDLLKNRIKHIISVYRNNVPVQAKQWNVTIKHRYEH